MEEFASIWLGMARVSCRQAASKERWWKKSQQELAVLLAETLEKRCLPRKAQISDFVSPESLRFTSSASAGGIRTRLLNLTHRRRDVFWLNQSGEVRGGRLKVEIISVALEVHETSARVERGEYSSPAVARF